MRKNRLVRENNSSMLGAIRDAGEYSADDIIAVDEIRDEMDLIGGAGGDEADSSPAVCDEAEDSLPVEQLRALCAAQRRELTAQHADIALLRPSLSSAETERVKLARRVTSLTAERDQYLKGMTEASQRLAAAKEESNNLRSALRSADELHERQRKDDTSLFQANLRRLLDEKSALTEEIEMMSGQKDALTEALVKANHSLEHSGRLSEELQTYRAQHREAAERLQAGIAERDAARLTAQHHQHASARLQGQLGSAQAAIAKQAKQIDSSRNELDAAQSSAAEATGAAERNAARARRLEASILLLAAEMSTLEASHAAATAAAAAAGSREACHVATCVADVARSEGALTRALDVARRRCDEAAAAKAERSAASAESEESARLREEAEAQTRGQLTALTAERDSAVSELAAQKRVADSLRQELKKAMQKAALAAQAHAAAG